MSASDSDQESPSPYSEDQLLQQWDFLDAMVERQAAALRSGAQDPEEDEEMAATPPPMADTAELADLRQRVAHLEAERATLLQGEARLADLQRQVQQVEAERSHWQTEIDALRSENARLTGDLGHRTTELERLNHSHMDLLAALRDAHSRLEALQIQPAEAVQPPPAVRRKWFRRR